jgi:hypothetical protein
MKKKILFSLFAIALFTVAFAAGMLTDKLRVNGTIEYLDHYLSPTSSLTNYTLDCVNAAFTVNLTNSVRLYILTNNLSGVKTYPSITFTNNSGVDQYVDLTNSWTAGNTFNNIVPTSKFCIISFEVEGSNVRYTGIVQP